jgi:putative sigma-54 modulation protein
VQIQISTRHGHVSEATQEKVRAKVDRLPRYFERLTKIEITIDLTHRDNPSVDLRVAAEHKHDFVATSQAGELLAAVDVVVEKMEQQLRKYKEKVQDRHRTTGAKTEAQGQDQPDSEPA